MQYHLPIWAVVRLDCDSLSGLVCSLEESLERLKTLLDDVEVDFERDAEWDDGFDGSFYTGDRDTARKHGFFDYGLCVECEARNGQLHQRGCEAERCPSCKGYLSFCDCREPETQIPDSERVPFRCLENEKSDGNEQQGSGNAVRSRIDNGNDNRALEPASSSTQVSAAPVSDSLEPDIDEIDETMIESEPYVEDQDDEEVEGEPYVEDQDDEDIETESYVEDQDDEEIEGEPYFKDPGETAPVIAPLINDSSQPDSRAPSVPITNPPS